MAIPSPHLPSSAAGDGGVFYRLQHSGTILRYSPPFDLTGFITARDPVPYCPDCSSYFRPPSTWLPAAPASPELLHILLLHCRGLDKLNILAPEFISTNPNPNPNRIKIRLLVQGKVPPFDSVLQSHLVEFEVVDRLCDSCSDQWVARVKLRQDVPHRRTFFYLEQLILKRSAADKAVKIRETDHGLDFMFSDDSHAENFVKFISGVAPVCSRPDNPFSLHIAPVCREDLIFLPPDLSRRLGNFGPLVVCTMVTDRIALLDVNLSNELRMAYLDGKEYWSSPFEAMMSGGQLVEYIVLDVELESSAMAAAWLEVARVSDFGKMDIVFRVRTHLGRLLKVGDYALGYDLYEATLKDPNMDKYRDFEIPDVVLIKKGYREKRQKPRAWKLKRLNVETDTCPEERIENDEYEEFLKDVEESPELRSHMSLYRNDDYLQSAMESTFSGDDDAPTVPLEELLADLDLGNAEEGNTDMMLTE